MEPGIKLFKEKLNKTLEIIQGVSEESLKEHNCIDMVMMELLMLQHASKRVRETITESVGKERDLKFNDEELVKGLEKELEEHLNKTVMGNVLTVMNKK